MHWITLYLLNTIKPYATFPNHYCDIGKHPAKEDVVVSSAR
jgi:hypothetical protein